MLICILRIRIAADCNKEKRLRRGTHEILHALDCSGAVEAVLAPEPYASEPYTQTDVHGMEIDARLLEHRSFTSKGHSVSERRGLKEYRRHCASVNLQNAAVSGIYHPCRMFGVRRDSGVKQRFVDHRTGTVRRFERSFLLALPFPVGCVGILHAPIAPHGNAWIAGHHDRRRNLAVRTGLRAAELAGEASRRRVDEVVVDGRLGRRAAEVFAVPAEILFSAPKADERFRLVRIRGRLVVECGVSLDDLPRIDVYLLSRRDDHHAVGVRLFDPQRAVRHRNAPGRAVAPIDTERINPLAERSAPYLLFGRRHGAARIAARPAFAGGGRNLARHDCKNKNLRSVLSAKHGLGPFCGSKETIRQWDKIPYGSGLLQPPTYTIRR